MKAYASMTAFASARGDSPQGGFALQLKSVNHRSLKISIHGLGPECEDKVAEHLRTTLERGCVDLYIQHDRVEQAEESFKAWLENCRERNLPLPSWSDYYARQAHSGSVSNLTWDDISPVLEELLPQFLSRREHEGRCLVECLAVYVNDIVKALSEIQNLLPLLQQERSDRLQQRLRDFSQELSADIRRDLGSEVASLMEKLDVSEECDRLGIHLDRFEKALKGESKGGKYLDFLSQEIFREINTLNNKSQSVLISTCSIEIKSAIEKIREQVQNLV